MIAISGLGSTTIVLFFAEVGDITNYSHPQQLVNLAGLSLREHSSGKFKGQSRISKRGRSRLRRALYLAIRPLVAQNPTFKALHHYYTKRPERPLKKQQSLIALGCKLLRVLFVIGHKQCEFDGSKLLRGLPNSAESELIYSIRAYRPSKGAYPTSTSWIRRTKECMDFNPVRNGRVSDRELCGDLTHGYSHVFQTYPVRKVGWLPPCKIYKDIPHLSKACGVLTIRCL
jgi:hypothetical protein